MGKKGGIKLKGENAELDDEKSGTLVCYGVTVEWLRGGATQAGGGGGSGLLRKGSVGRDTRSQWHGSSR